MSGGGKMDFRPIGVEGKPPIGVEGMLRALGKLVEHVRVGGREVRQDLPVQRHPGELEPVDEAAVGQSVDPRARADANVPQASEHPLAHAPVPVGVGQPALDGFPGGAVEPPAAADVPLGHLHDLLATPA